MRRSGVGGHRGAGRIEALRALAILMLIASLTAVRPAIAPEPASADPAEVTIQAVDAVTGDPITHFKWVVNLDNSHDQASLENPQSFSPVMATGDETNPTVSLPDTVAPDRGYLVSVYANDGVGALNDPEYKIGGTHFTLPQDAGDVVVELQPNPLPLATIKARVFLDNATINGEWDANAEPPPTDVESFHVVIEDRIGEVTTDWFGNPICTEYEDLNGNGVFDFPGDLDPNGDPVPIPGTGGFCHPAPDGIATIPNLGPDKYAVEAIPPTGSDWVQTSTIEGTLHNDAWIVEGDRGFATEPEAGLFTQVWFGFVRPCSFGDTGDSCPTNDTAGTGLVKGTVRTNKLDQSETTFVLGNPIPDAYVGLTDIGANDEQVYMARANPDGTFEIPDVPASTYILSIWDRSLDHIMKFLRFTVPEGGTIDIGGLIGSEGGRGVAPWFGKMVGSVYLDTNENGVRDPGETPIQGVDLDTRYKDGTIQYTAFTDNGGRYEFPEVFELEHFFISEVGYGRFKQTGVSVYNTDEFDNPVNYPWANDCTDIDGNPVSPCSPGTPERECTDAADWRTCEHGPIQQDFGLASLLQATFLSAGQSYYFDWGKNAFGAGENGGIVGIVFNATTRNELDASLQANEDYEPGVPGVTVNLYAPQLDATGQVVHDPVTGAVAKDHIANTYISDSWYDARPTDCVPVGSFGRDPTQIQPYPDIWDRCLELESLLNQDRPGVFDGGYAFDLDCSNPSATDPMDVGQLLPPDQCPVIGAGQWIVEITPPTGFRSVMEEDINVFSGDQFVPSVVPPPCAGPMHTVHVVDDPAAATFDPADPSGTQGVYNPDFLATPSAAAPNGGSPYEGQQKPLCNARLIDLKNGFNANSDFFTFTDARYAGSAAVTPTGTGVPVPGRIVGILLDDLALDLDPNSPNYAGKRGIPNTPIGLRDFTGKLVTTVYSDDLGRFEVLLPSTGTYNCPLPAGPCPGMYYVVGNDPGDPASPDPNFNPNYQTLPLVFDVWPGLTTYADVAIIPNTNFVAPGPHPPVAQFDTPPECVAPSDTPSIASVSQPYGTAGTGITVNGTGFGSSGELTLGGVPVTTTSWSNTSITFDVPAAGGVAPGARQLLVTNAASGSGSNSGMTFHVLGAGYNPPQRHVGPGQTYEDLQAALDDAQDGDLVLVHPQATPYFGHFIMHANVKLQGYGPGASILDGRFVFGATLDQAGFEAKWATIPFDGPAEVPWGQVLTVLAEDGEFHSGFNPQIDGFKIQYGRNERGNGVAPNQGGGVYVHGFARFLEVSNNVIQGNFGSRGGGVILGLPSDYHGILDAQNDNVRIHHNQVLNNGGKVHAGSLGVFNGAENYEIDHNFICGNYAAEYGGGVSHFGLSPGGRVHDNRILFNYAFDEGGGVMVGGELRGELGQPGTGLSLGSGPVTVERNEIRGNVSNDDGGGIRLLNPVQWKVRLVNNLVVDNLATDLGGGISLDDALDVEIVNNTVARNVTTATSEDADISCNTQESFATCPHGAGMTSEPHSQAVLDAIDAGTFNCAQVNCTDDFTNPRALFNNIFWHNEAFYNDGTVDLLGTTGLPSAGFMDLDVVDIPGTLGGASFDARFSDCTRTAGNPHCDDPSDISADPGFLDEVEIDFGAFAFANDPSFVYVLIFSSPGDPPGDYHVPAGSPVVNAATNAFGGVNAPCDDVDSDGRPNGAAWDIGADEQPGAEPCGVIPPPAGAQLYFSTAGNTAVPGVAGTPDNADVYSWNGTSFARVFDASGPGSAGLAGGVDVDALVVVDSDTLYLSFAANGGTTVPGITSSVQDEDVVRYDAGVWSLWFDGSDVGLANSNAEDVDAFELLADGSVVISTEGDPNVPGITGEADEDLLRCAGTFVPGTNGASAVTTCTWAYYFEGTDVGLAAGGEDIDGAAVGGSDLYLSTRGGFTVTGLSGLDEDVFRCVAATTGPASACASFSMFFDGSALGVTDNLDAIDVP